MMLSAKNFNFKKFLKKFIYGGIKQVCLRKGFTISTFTTYLCVEINIEMTKMTVAHWKA